MIAAGDDDEFLSDEQKLKLEIEGILNWAIEGCVRWQKDGLHIPAIVANATEDYRRDMDQFAQFLLDRCEAGRTYKTRAIEIADAYRSWSGDRGISTKRVADLLKRKGFKKTKKKDGNYWLKLRIAD